MDMERALIKEIIKYGTNLTIIDELSEDTEKELEKELLNIINSNTNNLDNEKIELMIDIFIKDCHEQIYAINYIQNINLNIKPYLYKKLKEPFYNENRDGAWELYEDLGVEYVPLNQFTLCDAIEFEYTDMVDVYLAQPLTEYISSKFKEANNYISHSEMQDFYKTSIGELEKSLKSPTVREENLLLFLFEVIVLKGWKLAWKFFIKENFHIKNNTPETNQEILDNSYDYIIEETNADKNSIIYDDKNQNNELFTNAKREVQLRKKNHFMSFLYKCNTGYLLNNDKMIFIEFVEAYICGYKQYKELNSLTAEEKKKRLKEYKRDLEALKKYNILNENSKNIKELTKEIKFLENPNRHYEMIIFKELSNQLEINTQQIANYITTIKSATSKKTILTNFDKISTKPTEAKITIL